MTNVKAILLAAITGAAAMAAFNVGAAEPLVLRDEWHFESDAMPAVTAGGASASVQLGQFASGWLDDLPVLAGGQGGYWDLGASGRITCSLAPGAAAYSIQSIKVQVRQWWDGGVWDLASVNVPGTVTASGVPDVGSLGTVGGWIVDETTFNPSSSAPLNEVLVTAGANGAIIDSIVLETTVVTPPPMVLEISPEQTVPGTVLVSWDEGLSGATLETSTDPANPSSWTALEATPQLVNGRYQVAVPAEGAARFFRLKR